MDCYRPIDRQLIDACQAYPPDFTAIRRLVMQGADVNAVSANDADDCVLSEIIFGYPEISELRAAYCESCKDENCVGCSLDIPDADGRYLPQIIQFFLENGFDVTRDNGFAGARVLESLKLSSFDRYILDGCKLLLHAGADPSLSGYTDDDESVLSSVATEASFQRCCEANHALENLFETMYQIMDAKRQGKNFWLIEYYDVCIGRRIDSIRLYSSEAPLKGVFPIVSLRSRHRNCFLDTVVLDCGGKQLCVTRYVDLFVDPHIPQNAAEHADLAPRFPDCVGHMITAIDFDHAAIQRGTTFYGQSIVLIRLDNGKTIRFSTNFGEMPEKDAVAWFSIE